MKKRYADIIGIISMIQSVFVSNEKKMELFAGRSGTRIRTPSACRRESHIAYNYYLPSIFH